MLIADRSAKSLRMLAAPLRIYRGHSSGHGAPTGRNAVLTDYLTGPADEMGIEDDDEEYESMMGSSAADAEGARIDSQIHDAFSGQNRWFPRRYPTSSSDAVNSAGIEEIREPPSPPLLHSPPMPNRSGSWALPTGSTLFRQPSIRRPTRSRIVDFNDFTSRRRSTIRQTLSASDTLGSRSEHSAEDPRRPISPFQPQLARRFFGISRNRRHESAGANSWSETLNLGPTEELASSFAVDPVSRPWFSIPTPSSSSSSQSDVEYADERVPGAPRLRRGGVRAPESMLSRNASPNLTEQDVIGTNSLVHLPVSPISENNPDDNVIAPANELAVTGS